MAPPAPATSAAWKLDNDNAGAERAWVALGLSAASTSQMIGSKKIRPSTPRAVLTANLFVLRWSQRAGLTSVSGALLVSGVSCASCSGICSVVMVRPQPDWTAAQGGAGGRR